MGLIIIQKESAILYHIQNTLAFGKVRYDKGANCYRFIVEDLSSLTKLAHLFNGNLFLKHRTEQFLNWINVLHSKSIFIVPNTNKVNISLKDGWLSGFTDAEGCFNVSIIKRDSYIVGFRTVLKFILDQNDSTALILICNLFHTGYVYQRNGDMYRYTVDSFKGLPFVISYFNLFPLKTIKHSSFIKWCDIYSMTLNKEHLNHKGFARIKLLAKLINDKSNMNN